MTATETTLTSSVGEKIFVRRWTPDSGFTKSAVLSHGVFEHSGRYHHVAERFVKHGYAVWAPDHVGHGQSGGPRGDIQYPNQFIDDMYQIVELATSESGAKPVLLGHSMGGAIAALYAVRHQDTLRALALSSPALKTHASGLIITIGRMAAAMLPTVQAPGGLSQPATHNAEWEAMKSNDPLAHSRLTLRLASFIVDAGDEARERAGELKLPVGMFVAGEDTYVDKLGSQEFFRSLRPDIGEYHEYADYYHEVFNETGRDKPLADLEAWLDKIDAAR